jgi:hypothetical protein
LKHLCWLDEMGYIKSNAILKLFYQHQLRESGEISILQIKSRNNLANLFTNYLSFTIFDKCVKVIGIRRLKRFARFRENFS